MVDVTDPLKMPHSYRDDSSIDDYEAIAVVGMFSFAICYTVLCCSTSAAQTGNSHYGLAAGMIVSLGMVVSDFLGCGSSLNPSFDAALVFTETIFDPKMSTLESSASFVKEDGEHAMWGPWLVGPTAGAMLAGFVYKYIKITAFTKRNHGCWYGHPPPPPPPPSPP
jgi:glycerol uptake facilitator-like aquaporin